jgi:hypothetical protein
MMTPNEFWLQLHRLAEAYQAEGESTEARLLAIMNEFQELAAPARREVLADLQLVTAQLPQLRQRLAAAVRDIPSAPPPPQEVPRERAG